MLENLIGTQDVFDLKIIGAPIEFDLIIDPPFGNEFCANGQEGDFNCDVSTGQQGWTNGNINDAKSLYTEGNSIPNRFFATGLDEDTLYELKWTYETTKG